MSLITPDFGLIVWMTLIFGIVLLILAKFGFPVITDSIRQRSEKIEAALVKAKEVERRMQDISDEHKKMLEDSLRERNEMLKAASVERARMIEKAREDAQAEAERLLEKSRIEINAEKESALRAVRTQMVQLSVQVAQKVLRKELSVESAQHQYIDRLIGELSDNPAQRKNS